MSITLSNDKESAPLRLGVDIDDVIYPCFPRLHTACEMAGITNGVTPRTWSPFNEYGCDPAAWYRVLDDYAEYIYSGDPIPGALDALQSLVDAGHQVHLVTARAPQLRDITVEWIETFRVPHDTLTFSADKTIIRVDIFADDAEKNIKQLQAAGVPTCLVDAAHNKDFEHGYRVADLSEFARDVLNNEWRVAA